MSLFVMMCRFVNVTVKKVEVKNFFLSFEKNEKKIKMTTIFVNCTTKKGWPINIVVTLFPHFSPTKSGGRGNIQFSILPPLFPHFFPPQKVGEKCHSKSGTDINVCCFFVVQFFIIVLLSIFDIKEKFWKKTKIKNFYYQKKWTFSSKSLRQLYKVTL